MVSGFRVEGGICAVQLVARLRVCGRSWRPLALSMQLCGDLETWHFDWPPRSAASAAAGSVQRAQHARHDHVYPKSELPHNGSRALYSVESSVCAVCPQHKIHVWC